MGTQVKSSCNYCIWPSWVPYGAIQASRLTDVKLMLSCGEACIPVNILAKNSSTASKPYSRINHFKTFCIFPSLSETDFKFACKQRYGSRLGKTTETSYPEVASIFFVLKYWLHCVKQKKTCRPPWHYRLSCGSTTCGLLLISVFLLLIK